MGEGVGGEDGGVEGDEARLASGVLGERLGRGDRGVAERLAVVLLGLALGTSSESSVSVRLPSRIT